MNNYTELIDASITGVYQNGIATKILQHMDRIRNVSDINQARRWIMELLQNSRDVAYDDQPVKIQIELCEKEIKFRHNGCPFRVKDILAVVNQVSSKIPGENTIGQFGTGFMTTYQLSECVEIQSVLKDEGLPYKPFQITIDRRGITKDEVLNGIMETMEGLKQADEMPEMIDFQKEKFNTCFCYHLENEESRKIAKIGMEDLEHTICYILLFSRQIVSVELIYQTENENRAILYERGNVQKLEAGISKLDIYRYERNTSGGENHAEETDTAGEKNHAEEIDTTSEKNHTEERSTIGMKNHAGNERNVQQLIFINQEGITLAAGWKEEEGFLPVPDCVPRIFVSFPLVGAEQFPFPVVLNHEKLRTNEPRSGITLVDNASSRDALVNKGIIKEAIDLYQVLLQYAVNKDLPGIQHLITIPLWKQDKELSENWVKAHIYKRLYNMIAQEAFIDTEKGKYALSDSRVFLVEGTNEEEREQISALVSALRGHIVPSGKENWCCCLAGYEVKEEKIFCLERLVKDAEDILKKELDESKLSAIEWCKGLYSLCRKHPQISIEMLAGNLKIFPNQDQEDWAQRKLFSISQLKKDTGISEILKDVCDVLDELPELCGEKLYVRKTLLHKGFMEGDIPQMEKYDLAKLTNHMINRSSRAFAIANYSREKDFCETIWEKAWCLMLSCGPDEEIYQISHIIFGEKLPKYEALGDAYDKKIWSNTYINILRKLITTIEKYKTVSELSQSIYNGGTEDDGYAWLNQVYGKIVEYINETELRNHNVIPNQKGKLCMGMALQRDMIGGEELKEIAAVFSDEDKSCDVYEVLLDKKAEAKFYLGEMYESTVAVHINQMVSKILSQQNLSDAKLIYQEACTRLLGWIQDNLSKAKNYFPSFWQEEDQMRLLTPKAAVNMQKKAKKWNQLLERLNVESIEEIEEKIKNLEKEVSRKSDSVFDWEWDVFYDTELEQSCPEENFREMLRQIGIEGEQYAKEQVAAYYQKEGYVVADSKDGVIILQKETSIPKKEPETGIGAEIVEKSEEVEGVREGVESTERLEEFQESTGVIERAERDKGVQESAETNGQEELLTDLVEIVCPDTEQYHQPGWDICVRRKKGEMLKTLYFEVKTHTSQSINRNILLLSNEQMKKAAGELENYFVLTVEYDWQSRQPKTLYSFQNPVERIAKGDFKSSEGQYKLFTVESVTV